MAAPSFPEPAPLEPLQYPEEGETLLQLMRGTQARAAELPALHWQDAEKRWHRATWREYEAKIRTAAKALIALGLPRGGCISVQSFNCPEYFYVNYAAPWAGAHAAGIYTTNTAEQSAYVASHSESRVVFVEDGAQLRKFLEERANLPGVHRVVQFFGDPHAEVKEAAPGDEEAAAWVMSWAEFEELGETQGEEELEARGAAVRPDDLCALIYTSGTTGRPKAVMISHRNVTFAARLLVSCAPLTNADCGVSYLPLSHIAAQLLDMHGPLASTAQVYFARPDALKGTLRDTLVKARPTFFFGVPRVWEKFQEAMLAKGRGNPAPLRALAGWAKGVGLRNSYARQDGQPGPWFGLLADALVGARVRAALGLDRCRFFYSAAAPISIDTVEYFMSLGIRVHQAYGMSESTGVATMSLDLKGRNKTGTVGQVAQGTELRIADDGEICFRGPHVFQGYLKNEEATREALDDEGWLHSGDIGRLDENGFLLITGRKKELAISAGGENIAPLALEEAMRSIPVVSQCVVIADKRKFVSALVTLDEGLLPSVLKACGSEATDPASAAKDETFCKHLMSLVGEVNKHRMPSRAAFVRKFTIIPAEFSIDGGELTPTHKIKRRIIDSKYEAEIEAMYAE